MPDFARIIHLAYQRILGRPADLDGLDNYNRLMNRGLSEADMRESLLRSAEYAEKNPGAAPAATARKSTEAGKRKKKARRGR
jgi:hypothetical protein